MIPAAPLQLVGVDEITRHGAVRVKCSVPEVIVPSVYVPSALAAKVPVTCRSPLTGAVGQPAPTSVRSRLPLTFRQEEETVQVPVRSPPQAVPFEQDAPA